eukprot:COSAG01_NODE_5811_length_4018_cov_10.544271_3_plen_59_part_00
MTADQLSFLTGRGLLCTFQRRGGGGLRLFGGAHTGLGRRPRSQPAQPAVGPSELAHRY